MYDTLHLNYNIVENQSTTRERVFENTDNITESYSLKSNEGCISAELGNLKVSMNPRTVSVRGSICKYYLGNNLYTLNRGTTKEALDSVSDAIGLDIKKASLSRLDWSTNISTSLPTTLYMPKLGYLSRHIRTENPNSIYYNQSTKRLLFYDKMKEAKKNKVIIPDEFIDENLLRYEMVLNKGVNKHLNADIRGGNLYSEDIYFKVAKLWIKNYHSINKLNNKGINISIDKVKTEGDFDKALLTGLAQQLGMEEINQYLKLMKAKKVFNHNEYYSRIKNKYRIMCNTEVDSEDIISEINRKIDYCYKNLI
ncbi:MAG: hypothetical protein P8N20_03025 [Flavobacteriaceae bacterium]|nr:hypothetical protein [Flavobacteriaceae bacterium]